MRVVVVGASGHIGTYLVPRLAEEGHEVVAVSRGRREPYREHPAWGRVRRVEADRGKLESRGDFGAFVRDLDPDAVIDLICFTPESARQLAEALRGRVEHFLHCGTIWVHGHSTRVPTTEDQARRPFGEYGTNKARIEAYLLAEARRGRLPATVLHPGHIVGEGWVPVNPQGNFEPAVFGALARGEELPLPNLGLETVHHVHADDVAQAFVRALSSWSASVGESFHVVSPQAVTLRGYAEAVAGWFGREAHLRFVPFEEWRGGVSEEAAEATWDHIAHSPNCSIEKARRLLGYEPRYTSLEAVREALLSLEQTKGAVSGW
ncbi:NAD-dependent epimerase/dehydratase family protein [Rubrobacter calidifluminis]|uniref:NAD-dependent epimerase/dehydratase family protein n=1 Tax=Rubrobacter calidifluminis TaxID=1392640 RepID=UPI00236291C1|nr:NAD-dependent epimerase/dehydratase family protein [Rubrobacter calidifluminis]